MNKHEKLNYVEFPSNNLMKTKMFFENVFGWEFTDYGEHYTSFNNQGLDGGFYTSDAPINVVPNAALLVFYSDSLSQSKGKVLKFGGKLSKEIFEFPGGHRFHFIEPGGNELAIWTDM